MAMIKKVCLRRKYINFINNKTTKNLCFLVHKMYRSDMIHKVGRQIEYRFWKLEGRLMNQSFRFSYIFLFMFTISLADLTIDKSSDNSNNNHEHDDIYYLAIFHYQSSILFEIYSDKREEGVSKSCTDEGIYHKFSQIHFPNSRRERDKMPDNWDKSTDKDSNMSFFFEKMFG